MFNNYQFASPEFLWLEILVVLLAIYYFWKGRKRNASLAYSSAHLLGKLKPTLKQRLRYLPVILRLISLSLLFIALARPQTSSNHQQISTEGIDIVLAIDISTSMLAEDFEPNRLGAAKKTASDFITSRVNDRIGLVIFAGESFTQCPVTIDHNILINMFESLQTGMVKDGTAIGDGLATAITRLKDSEAKSKVVILLTDGVNNSGFVSPETAAEIARTYGIKVYTIGVGTKGKAPYPYKTTHGTKYQNVDVDIDEGTLTKIAELSGGQYFRATDNKSLEEIYSTIDEMEKTKIDVSYFNQYSEEYLIFALIAFALFSLELLLRLTYLRTMP